MTKKLPKKKKTRLSVTKRKEHSENEIARGGKLVEDIKTEKNLGDSSNLVLVVPNDAPAC